MRKAFIIIFCILGFVVGMALGQFVAGIDFLSWLNIGGEFGIQNPFTLDLGFIKLTLGFWIKVNVAGVIGMITFALLSRKLAQWLKI